ncbi:MAG: hypothetical protein LBB23_00900 [Rickettsiales bacterium]|jgi:hypothetical protein|nr:hypothetical protein [Rickettsiales bacterium]
MSESFEQISNNKWGVFGMPYESSQIIRLREDGEETFDGNTKYYWKPEYQFDPQTNFWIQEKFYVFNLLGREYGMDINQVIIVPIKYKENESAKCVGEITPEAYDFNLTTEWARGLVVPFNGEIPLDFGICTSNTRPLDGFVCQASLSAIGGALGGHGKFREGFCAALAKVATK